MTLIKRFIFAFIVLALSVSVLITKPFQLGLDLKGGVSVVLEAQDTEDRPVTNDDVLGVIDVITGRINALGLTEPVIQRKGLNQIIVELPGIKDIDRALALIGETAQLTFHEAEWAPQNLNRLTEEEKVILLGENANIVYLKQVLSNDETLMRPLILKKKVIQGSQLEEAFPGTDSYGRPVVNIKFNSEARDIFYETTKRSVGRPIAILLDGIPVSAPNVDEPILGGNAVISGSFTAQEVKDLVIKLRAGSLPVPVTILSNRLIGPTLGLDSIENGKRAAIIGLVGVVIYMILFFRFFGVMAVLALIYYATLTLGVLKLMDATLTLPGIAGLILTLGMAVDANIIIFARIREELNKGESVLSAVNEGFSKAFIAIIDSNVTTLFAAMVLFWLGTGSIKGFALTLSIGVLVSMFSALFVTKFLIKLFLTFINLPKRVLIGGKLND
ncbi:MAG: protein translocase subunit SecD [Candidatus Margulisiibacteriota bacterium]|nr:protein translocase subunit SecD [Candidatus Margulisiibacteriota bacterium]